MTVGQEVESDFGTFNPRVYLEEYYATIDHENDQLLRFFVECYQDISPQSTLLEFGCGPTLYSLITAATKVSTIHVCDRLESNLHELELWKRGDREAFRWDSFIRRALELEKRDNVTQDAIQKRIELLRRTLTILGTCDAFRNPPLSASYGEGYDIVQVNFVPESITSSLSQWEEAMRNILSLLKPRGTFILTALKGATYYQMHNKSFPAVNINESIVVKTLKKYGFREADIKLQSISANIPYRGYSGMIFIRADARV